MSPSPPTTPEDDQAKAIFDIAYAELKRLARHVRRGSGSETLRTTALVHEAFLKVGSHAVPGHSREHLRAIVTRAMRQILIDHARAQQTAKRGGGAVEVTLDNVAALDSRGAFDLLAVDQALVALEALNMRLAQVVELHVIGGLSMAEIAQYLGVTERTAFRDWRKARAFLVERLG